MKYEGIVIRPPSEAQSIIIQATIGCSHNGCSFCGAYQSVRFRIRSDDEINQDLFFASRFCHSQKRVFLADGDALIIPFRRLETLLIRIRQQLPWVNRISLYASARSIRSKSDAELARLRQLGLDRVYLGIESGDDAVLADMAKDETAQSLEGAGRHILVAGLFLSTTVILGLAGSSGSSRHARCTAALLNRLRPHQIAALSLMLLDNTELAARVAVGRFQPADPRTILAELAELVESLTVDRVQFMANHASNYLPLAGRLQRDNATMLATIEAARAGRKELVAENARAL
ncbi:MAG: radical SAM protein [Desulfofustis sp.]|nr:radical SAM protein [Desulfofustis sp.]